MSQSQITNISLSNTLPIFVEAIDAARGTKSRSRFICETMAEAIGYRGPISPGDERLNASAYRAEIAELKAELAALRSAR
jgi:hypothetical protein